MWRTCAALRVVALVSVKFEAHALQVKLKAALFFFTANTRAVANSNVSYLCYPKPPCFCPGSNHKGLHLAARTNAEVINLPPPPSSRPCSLTLAPLRRGRARWLRSSKAGGVREELRFAAPGRASRGRRMSFSRRQGGCQLEPRLRKGTFCRRPGGASTALTPSNFLGTWLHALYTHRKESPLPATSGASCVFFHHSCASLLFYYVLFIFFPFFLLPFPRWDAHSSSLVSFRNHWSCLSVAFFFPFFFFNEKALCINALSLPCTVN